LPAGATAEKFLTAGKTAKEFSMKNFFKLFGIIAFIAVIGFSMIGCEFEQYAYEWSFKNQSSYTIQVEINSGYDLSPKSFSITPGAEQKCGTNTKYSTVRFEYRRADTHNTTGIRFSDSSDFAGGTFYNQ
jgi:hypothetical protein